MMDQDKNTTWTAQDVVAVMRALASEADLPSRLVTGDISEADTMETLGIDSLGQVYLVERLEQLTGVLMPDEFLDVNDSLTVIATSLNELVRSKK